VGVALRVDTFGGMLPARDDRLLPEHSAALAQNTYLYSGQLRGMYQMTDLHTLVSASAVKVFRIPNNFSDAKHFSDSTWLEFQNQDTDVVRGPVVGDTYQRYYWASSNAQPRYNTLARIQAGNNELLLGVPQPLVAPGVSVSGGSGGTVARAYVYTWVTAYGEEGPPSTPTIVTGFANGTWNITLSAPLQNDTNLVDRNISKARIYRTVTGSNGVATYFLVAELGSGIIETGSTHTNTTIDVLADTSRIAAGYAVTGTGVAASTVVNTIASASVVVNNATTATASGVTITFAPKYADTIADATVVGNNQLASTTWSAPPTDLQGWVAMPNGIIAGWRANEVWFCEPYRPHAWPAQYSFAIDYDIVGLGVSGQTLVIATKGLPYWAYGVHPSTIKNSKIETPEPCMSRGSVVSAPEGVYYASPNGLVLIVQGAASNVTRAMLTKDKWLSRVPTDTLRAVRLGTMYYGWGSGRTGVFQDDTFEDVSFDQQDLGGARTGVLIDLADQRVAMTTLANDDPSYNTMNDVWTGEVFVIRDGKVFWLNIGDQNPTPEAYVWRSKIFQAPNKRNLGAMKVYFEVPATLPALNPVPNTNLVQTLASGQYGLVRLYADGVLVWTRELRTSGELMRLPSGFKADFWQVEINAYVSVSNLQIGESAKDLRKT
jgi:hypothetical protein